MNSVLSIEPFHWFDIGAALLCGLVIGLERQLRGKPVGIRTSSLIVLGTYFFVVAASSVATEFTDPSRIIGQVVTGVGFLGAGVMMTKDGTVLGVTSAAVIWGLAALGVVVAVGESLTAIKLSLLLVAVLYGVDMLENYSTMFTRGVHSRYRDWRRRSTDSK
ncbi:MgtC/SapB family protein [Salinispirillum sp. LH 10-3-1]|uniref:Protein MgtC n=1 Tax=Salinispirillum sp. LH 10-3-1 TaxID=2952525 RepID=A0AB38YHZ8_9GAMM